MIQNDDGAGVVNDASNLTPNPFPRGKGNRKKGFFASLRMTPSDKLVADLKPPGDADENSTIVA
jgi:hypothetical protein